MKTLIDLLPLVAGLAVVAGVIWFLLARDMGLGRWLLAVVLVGHGWVHAMFLMPLPARTGTGSPSDEAFARTFDLTRSWLVNVGLDAGAVRAVATLLIIGVVAGFMLAALSAVGLLVPAEWWRALVIGSSVASVALLGIAFSPTLLLGFAINAVLLWVAVASVWSPTALAGAGAA